MNKWEEEEGNQIPQGISVLKAFPIRFLSNFPTATVLLKDLQRLCFHMWKAALRVNYWLPHIRGEL